MLLNSLSTEFPVSSLEMAMFNLNMVSRDEFDSSDYDLEQFEAHFEEIQDHQDCLVCRYCRTCSNKLINHILSYRGPHPTAVIWNDVLIGLNDMSQKRRDVLSFITYYFYVNKVDLIYKKEFLLYEEYEDFFNRIAGRSHNYRVGEVINDYEIRMEYYRRSYCHSCDVYDLDVSIGLNPTPLHCYIEYR
jgi:hypothetical protein